MENGQKLPKNRSFSPILEMRYVFLGSPSANSLSLSGMPVTEQELVLRRRTNCSDRETITSSFIVHPVATIFIKSERPGSGRIICVKRTWPVSSIVPIIEIKGVSSVFTCGWEEDAVAIRCGISSSMYTIQGRPWDSRVLEKFLPLFLGRHTPVWAHIGKSSIILKK